MNSANRLYYQNRKGRDDRWDVNENIINGHFLIRSKYLGKVNNQLSEFRRVQYKLNMESLYFLDEDDSYRSVLYGIQLLNVPSRSDNM